MSAVTSTSSFVKNCSQLKKSALTQRIPLSRKGHGKTHNRSSSPPLSQLLDARRQIQGNQRCDTPKYGCDCKQDTWTRTSSCSSSRRSHQRCREAKAAPHARSPLKQSAATRANSSMVWMISPALAMRAVNLRLPKSIIWYRLMVISCIWRQVSQGRGAARAIIRSSRRAHRPRARDRAPRRLPWQDATNPHAPCTTLWYRQGRTRNPYG